nr:hypothetical protein [Deltaproteobacteria bacterium]
MSKRDDDADMEVGMTTAERRRRRRRGGGLRVPSDNVPRRTNPPVVAPVPEDPALAMSIAYSFSSDASEPVPRVDHVAPRTATGGADTLVNAPGIDPTGPEAMPTLIDTPVASEEAQDFEMKTREMSAVDLEALGLTEPGTSMRGIAQSRTTTDPGLPGVQVKFRQPTPRPEDVDVDMGGFDGNTLDEDEPTTIGDVPAKPKPQRERHERLKTMALTEEDLEEVRETMRAQTQPASIAASAATTQKLPTQRASTAPLPPLPRSEGQRPTPAPGEVSTLPATNAQTAVTKPIPVVAPPKADEPMSVPEIDINELADRAESSGEFEVDVDDDGDVRTAPSTPPAAAAAPATPPAAPADAMRPRPGSIPPPMAPSAATTHP